MTSILGIIASSKYGVPNSYESIATVNVGSGGASDVTFSSIPSTYQHLQIRAFGNGVYSSVDYDDFSFQFNGDTGNNYSWHRLRGNGSNAAASATTSTYRGIANYNAVANTANNIFGVSIIDILDYKNTNKYKTTRALGGVDFNGSGGVGITSSLWMNTNAITSIRVFEALGDFRQYTSIALYGIKG